MSAITVVFKPHHDADMPNHVLGHWDDAPFAPSIHDYVVVGGQGDHYLVKHRVFIHNEEGTPSLIFCYVVPDNLPVAMGMLDEWNMYVNDSNEMWCDKGDCDDPNFLTALPSRRVTFNQVKTSLLNHIVASHQDVV